MTPGFVNCEMIPALVRNAADRMTDPKTKVTSWAVLNLDFLFLFTNTTDSACIAIITTLIGVWHSFKAGMRLTYCLGFLPAVGALLP